jgi:hypothetical protein
MRQLADEDFDENGVLRDGKRFRVPMKFGDSKSRYFADGKISEGRGNGGLALQRPGFRITDQQKRNWSTIYDAYDIAISARIHDGNGNSGAALQRPGFRVADAFARDEAKVAYEQYEASIQNEWRSIRTTDFGSPGIGPDETTCNQDKPENDRSDLDADVDEHVKAFDRQRDGNCERGPRRQSSDVATLMRDHQERMAALYAERERELQEEWRCGK